MRVTLPRVVRLYLRFQWVHLRTPLEYEADFLLGIAGIFLSQLGGLVFFWAIFARTPAIAGWTLPEAAMLYGLLLVPRGLVDLFGDGPWTLSYLVSQGEFDRLLVRPAPLLLQVFSRSSRLHGVGHIGLGALVLGEATRRLHFDWTARRVGFLALSFVASSVIIASISLAANCTAFWDRGGGVAAPTLALNLGDAATAPLPLYPRAVQGLLTWVVPFAFVSYFPACALLGKPLDWPWMAWGGPAAALAAAAAAFSVWRFAVKRYESTGT